MENKTLSKETKKGQTIFSDLLKPWDEWIDNGIWFRTSHTPPVNIIEEKDYFKVMLAAPGMKKADFKIVLNGNNKLTITTSTSETKEAKPALDYLRNEYNYTNFSRSLTLPEEIKKDAIVAKYEEGILEIHLPRAEEKTIYPEQTIVVK